MNGIAECGARSYFRPNNGRLDVVVIIVIVVVA